MTRLPDSCQAGMLTNCTPARHLAGGNLAELPQEKEAIREIRRN
jgi:hypothetical protein